MTATDALKLALRRSPERYFLSLALIAITIPLAFYPAQLVAQVLVYLLRSLIFCLFVHPEVMGAQLQFIIACAFGLSLEFALIVFAAAFSHQILGQLRDQKYNWSFKQILLSFAFALLLWSPAGLCYLFPGPIVFASSFPLFAWVDFLLFPLPFILLQLYFIVSADSGKSFLHSLKESARLGARIYFVLLLLDSLLFVTVFGLMNLLFLSAPYLLLILLPFLFRIWLYMCTYFYEQALKGKDLRLNIRAAVILLLSGLLLSSLFIAKKQEIENSNPIFKEGSHKLH